MAYYDSKAEMDYVSRRQAFRRLFDKSKIKHFLFKQIIKELIVVNNK